MKILLVYPQSPDTFWSFKHALRFVSKKSTFPPLGLLTIAAMLPVEWELKLVDTNVERLKDRDIRWADFVFLSAMIVHEDSVREIAARCSKLDRKIIAGGPLFTTGHQRFPEIPHFVLGEAEDLMPAVVADMLSGRIHASYSTDVRPDITTSPSPRWDLINLKNYVTLGVQFSRGCPFDCEFCDITIMNGRVPRTKKPAQLIRELEGLSAAGWRDMVFIVDDNFIGNRGKSRELLKEVIAWRKESRVEMGFLTEASVNLADDAELLQLMVEAGFKKVFLGLETPSIEGLKECHKVQNTNRDLLGAVKTLQAAGLEVMGGFIVGFDTDPADIFKRQFDFIQRSGVATAMVGLLNALPQTRLYHRLKKEGRLEDQSTGNNTEATINFKPRLNREFLQSGYRELMKKLYEPRAYYQRIRTFMNHHKPAGPNLRLSGADVQAFFKSFWVLGIWHKGRRAYWSLFWGTLLSRPRQFRYAMELAILGYHFRRVARSL